MRIIITSLFLLALLKAPAQLHYVCYAASGPVTIDGKDDDPAWKGVPWSSDFVDIEGELKPRPALQTRVKMIWDAHYLYVYADLQEPDLWGRLHMHDTVIYMDNDFEVFINPDNSTHRYFEYEINALNTEMDLFMNKPYKVNGNALLSWDAQGLRSAVQLHGTINKPGDADKGWSVEIAIPLASMQFWYEPGVVDSTLWRINFSRVEWDKDAVNGGYVARTDSATGRRLPEHNWVWSPQGIIDMHVPQQWGYLQFSKHTPADPVSFVPPADADARALLWETFNREMTYRRTRDGFATNLAALGIAASKDGYEITLEATAHQFLVLVQKGNMRLAINQEGLVMK